jgi:hypothetical protein
MRRYDDEEDDDYGSEYKKYGAYGNMSNHLHRDTYRQQNIDSDNDF